MSTAQMQLVAEELCVPFHRVNLIFADTSMTPDQGVTSGSQSHPANFNHSNLAGACATAREALLQLGSKHLNIPVDQLIASRRRDSLERAMPRRKWPTANLWPGRNSISKSIPPRNESPPASGPCSDKPIARPDMPADGHGHIRVCAQRARARHAAWHGGSPGGRGRAPHECGRKLGRRNAGIRESCRQKEFCRRGRAKTLAGRADRQEAESHVDARSRSAEAGNFLRSSAESKADARHAAR